MNQGTHGYSLTKKNQGRKSHDTVPLTSKAKHTEKCPGNQSWRRTENTVHQFCFRLVSEPDLAVALVPYWRENYFIFKSKMAF
jgi:hypothetical protein